MNEPCIYLCDDDEGVRSSIAFLLRQHDLAVVPYASGPELLLALESATSPVRGIFVLDVRMEPLSGLQIHEALIHRGLASRMPVLFLSGHGDIPMAVGAMARGAFSFVEKPYADEALVQLIRQAPGTGVAVARPCRTPRRFAAVDSQSATAAIAPDAHGGGRRVEQDHRLEDGAQCAHGRGTPSQDL